MVFGHEIAYHIAVVGEMPPNDERRILNTYQRYSEHYKSYGSLLLLLMPTKREGPSRSRPWLDDATRRLDLGS